MNGYSPKIRRNAGPYQLLEYLALGTGVVVISLVAPAATANLIYKFLAFYIKRKCFERTRLENDLRHLQERKLIRYRKLENGQIEIKITAAGREKTIRSTLESLHLKIPAKWDRRWRLILFDIPQSLRKIRDMFRTKLVDLKFHPLQKSVYIIPYPCEDEINFLSIILGVEKYILLLPLGEFEGDKKLKRHFRLE